MPAIAQSIGRARWLVAALILLVIASLLMTRREKQKPSAKPVEFPRPNLEAMRRSQSRLVLAPAPSSDPSAPPAARDPVLAALPSNGHLAVVLEAAAVRDSPLGGMLLRCLAGQGHFPDDAKGNMSSLMGEVDRWALSDKVGAMSGKFAEGRWDAEKAAKTSRRYGDKAVIYEGPANPGGASVFATYGTDMVLQGHEAKEIEAAIDRIEGKGTTDKPAISPSDAYGEVYGVVQGAVLGRILPAEIREQFDRAAESIELHMDARGDVLIVADAMGSHREALEDVGRTLGGLLAAARFKARQSGEEDLVRLLEASRVSMHEQGFRVEIAVPLEFVAKTLGACAGADAGR